MRNNKQLREALIALCFSVWNSSNGKSSSFQLLNELSGNFISLLFITNASQSGSGCCFFPRCTQSGTVVMQIVGGAAAAKKSLVRTNWKFPRLFHSIIYWCSFQWVLSWAELADVPLSPRNRAQKFPECVCDQFGATQTACTWNLLGCYLQHACVSG